MNRNGIEIRRSIPEVNIRQMLYSLSRPANTRYEFAFRRLQSVRGALIAADVAMSSTSNGTEEPGVEELGGSQQTLQASPLRSPLKARLTGATKEDTGIGFQSSLNFLSS